LEEVQLSSDGRVNLPRRPYLLSALQLRVARRAWGTLMGHPDPVEVTFPNMVDQ